MLLLRRVTKKAAKLRNLLLNPGHGRSHPHNRALKAYCLRRIARGKEAKIAIIAWMRKLITVAHIPGSSAGRERGFHAATPALRG
jgi:hypothetical protein